MLNKSSEQQSLLVHYSPTSRYSIGYRFEQHPDKKLNFSFFQLTNLLRRWNKQNSQTNLYFKSGLGIAHCEARDCGSTESPAMFTGIVFDWETRRYFFSYENRYLESHSSANQFSEALRVGVAPYLGNYGQLHTWLMLQVDHQPQGHHDITLTPLLRFFKGSHLMELGISDYGDAYFSWISRLT